MSQVGSSDDTRCLLCEAHLPHKVAERCLTDCAHEFCLACICRELAERKNRCPACHAQVKKLHQLATSDAAAAPASIKFCNATYVLDVSIWSVDDPARVLASLFHLEHARLIHQGKLLKKGDVWPGTVVQLFGTRKSSTRRTSSNALSTSLTSYQAIDSAWLKRAREIVCCPCSVLVDFFRSLFVANDEATQRPQRGYTRVATSESSTTASAASFSEPGRVAQPSDLTDSH